MSGEKRGYSGWQSRRMDALGLAVVLAMLSLGYAVAVHPVYTRMAAQSELAQSIASETARVDELSGTLHTLNETMEATRKTLSEGVPQLETSQALNHHLARLTELGAANSVRIDGIEPGKTERSQYFDTTEIRISGKGTYQNCTRFLSQLYRSAPDTAVTSIELVGRPGEAAPLATFQVTIAWFTIASPKLAQQN